MAVLLVDGCGADGTLPLFHVPALARRPIACRIAPEQRYAVRRPMVGIASSLLLALARSRWTGLEHSGPKTGFAVVGRCRSNSEGGSLTGEPPFDFGIERP